MLYRVFLCRSGLCYLGSHTLRHFSGSPASMPQHWLASSLATSYRTMFSRPRFLRQVLHHHIGRSNVDSHLRRVQVPTSYTQTRVMLTGSQEGFTGLPPVDHATTYLYAYVCGVNVQQVYHYQSMLGVSYCSSSHMNGNHERLSRGI